MEEEGEERKEEEEEEERTQSHIQCLSELRTYVNYQYVLVMLPSTQVTQHIRAWSCGNHMVSQVPNPPRCMPLSQCT